MKKIFFYAGALLIFAACENINTNNTAEDSHSTDSVNVADKSENEILFEKNGIKISYLEESPNFPDAKLTFLKPDISSPVKEGKTLFQFKVEDFQLTQQTEDAPKKHCNNSEKGQHIHHILNNEPYTAHYTDTFSQDLKPGNYVNLAFLSRSYHESLKHNTAFVLNTFTVGNQPAAAAFDTKSSHMFYSRPKGEYVGKDTEKILLDFYLVNTELSENGNKVRATINGTDFTLTKWVPYAIYGLPMGENTIKLELLDKDNNVIPGPFNTVERKITLKN